MFGPLYDGRKICRRSNVPDSNVYSTRQTIPNCKPQRMVRWYDPLQLLRSGSSVLVSNVFGRHADHRLIEALGPRERSVSDLSVDENGHPRDEIGIDYVGDVGDGWNSTYAVAYYLARP